MDGTEKENKSAVKTETGGSSHQTGLSLHLHTLPAPVPHSRAALQQQGLGQSLFHSRRGSGMYLDRPRPCKGEAGDMFFWSRKVPSPLHVFLSHNRAEEPLSSVIVPRTKLQCPRQDRPASERDAWLKHCLLANLSSALPPWAPTRSHRELNAWHTRQLFATAAAHCRHQKAFSQAYIFG